MKSLLYKSSHLIVLLTTILITVQAHAQDRPLVEAGEPFGLLPLVDEVIIGESEESHGFVESGSQVSIIEEILGQPTRVLVNEGETSFIGYRIGADRGLEAGQAYVLSIDYPEDAPRTIYVVNRGGEYARGFSTGSAVGDVVQTYTYQNLESIQYPLTQQHQSWKSLFFLHERFPGQRLLLSGAMARPEVPSDGFMVYIAQPGTWPGASQKQSPRSAGAAVSRIRLFEVPNPEEFSATINYPPEDLPRRHLFWREEMSDGAVHLRNNQTAVDQGVDWFEHKARLMKFLGMNTYAKDLLEFGANQGWDSEIHGGNDWVHQSDNPQRWSQILDMLGRYNFYVLPMYEYSGSKGDNGLGYQRRARPLRRDRSTGESTPCAGYTHIWWAERANVDVADPDTLEDFRKMLDATMIRHRDRVQFLGAWVRTRNSSIPMSFSDFSINLFNQETAQTPPITRASLIADADLKLSYEQWWFDQRKKFIAGVRDILHDTLGSDSILLYTAYHEEPGPSVTGSPVTDDVETWTELGYTPRDIAELMSGGQYLETLLGPLFTWDDGGCPDPEKKRFEWTHSSPRPDPDNTKDLDGFLFTYPFNRLYSTSDPVGFDAFRGPAGVAMIRHYSLNENVMNVPTADGADSLLGYFVTDVDRNGPYSMLAEARALAFGDPRYIGYLSSQRYNRGFPQYVRRFNEAFLSLPAVPSERLESASNHPEVIVRRYETAEHGLWFAIINTSLDSVSQVEISLPSTGTLRHGVTEEPMTMESGILRLDLYPGEVRSLHLSLRPDSVIPTEEEESQGGMDEQDEDRGGDQTEETGGQSMPEINSNEVEAMAGSVESDQESTSSESSGCASLSSSFPQSFAWLFIAWGFVLAHRRSLFGSETKSKIK